MQTLPANQSVRRNTTSGRASCSSSIACGSSGGRTMSITGRCVGRTSGRRGGCGGGRVVTILDEGIGNTHHTVTVISVGE